MRAEWNEVLQIVAERVRYDLRVALPARVVRVKAEAGTVDLEVGALLPQVNPEDEPREVEGLLDVPVAFPSSPTVEIAWAIQAGDPGLILIADHHLGNWLEVGRPIAPGVRTPHDLSNAVFLPGAVHPVSTRVPIPAEGVVVGVRGGEALEVVGNEVRGGRGASEPAIEGSSYTTAEQTFVTAVQAFMTATAGAATAAQIATAAAAFNVAMTVPFVPGDHLGSVTKVK